MVNYLVCPASDCVLQDRLPGGLVVPVHPDLVDGSRPHDLVGRRAMWPGPGLGRVGEGEPSRVDNTVISDQAYRYL